MPNCAWAGDSCLISTKWSFLWAHNLLRNFTKRFTLDILLLSTDWARLCGCPEACRTGHWGWWGTGPRCPRAQWSQPPGLASPRSAAAATWRGTCRSCLSSCSRRRACPSRCPGRGHSPRQTRSWSQSPGPPCSNLKTEDVTISWTLPASDIGEGRG